MKERKAELQKLIDFKKLKGANRKPRYATRKLSIGLVSCMLGFVLLVSPQSVEASEVAADAPATTEAEPAKEEVKPEADVKAEAPVKEAKNEELEVAPKAEPTALKEDKPAEDAAKKEEAKEDLSEYKKAAIEKIEKAFEDVDAENASKPLDEYKEAVEKAESKKAIDEIVEDAEKEPKKVEDRAALGVAEENTPDAVGAPEKKSDLEEKGDKNRDKAEPTANPLDFGLKKDGTIEEKNAADAVANKAELTEAKSYDWVKKPEFGDSEAQVKVTYKDGSYDILKVAITTPKKPDEREGSNIITKGGNSFEDAIDASTDKTPKSKNTFAGFAWIENEPNFGSRDDGDIPAAGKKVYLQWKDSNGVVSPMFSTVVKDDGSFIFDLSRPVKNADGSVTKWQLAGNADFSVKVWAEEMDGYSIVKSGDMYSSYITRTYRTATAWNFTAGINYIDNAQIQYQRKPNVEGWLAKPEDQWSRPETPDGYWPDTGRAGTMRGYVWNENGETSGGVTNEYLFQKGNGDVAAVGTEVVASYVNDEVARQFDAWTKANKGYTHEQFKQAQKKIIKDYDAQHGKGSAIAETVVGKVDKDGYYRIPFRGLYGVSRDRQNPVAQTSNKVTDEEFGTVVKDEDITNSDTRPWDGIVNLKARHINYDYSYVYPLVPKNKNVWMKMYEDNMFQSSYSIGGQLNAGTSINGIQFALLASRAQHHIINKDTNENFGKPGEVVLNESQGLHNNQEYVVRWFRDGKPIGEAKKVISDKDGALSSFDVTVENDLTQDTMYTSAVFPPNSKADNLSDAILADSFVARPIVKKVNKADPVKDGYVRVSFLSGEDGTFDGGATEQYYDILENYTLAEAKEAAKGSATPLNIPNATPTVEKSTFEAWKLDTNNKLQSLDAENLKLKDLADANNKLKEGVPVTFVAGYAVETEKSKYEPAYKEVPGKVGEEATVAAPTFTDKEGKPATPANVTYEIGEGAPAGAKVNADGSVTYTPVDGDAGKTVEVPVVVKYSDGTTDDATAKINVAKKDSDVYTPSYADKDGKAGKPVTTDAPTFTDADGKATTAPEGTKYKLGDGAPEGATIDENTGKVTYTPNESEAGKPVEIPVVVTYPDQSTDKTTAKINVAKLDDVIDRTNDPNAETPAGYHRVTFEAGEGVEALTNPPVYDVKDGVALPADKYPTAKAKEGYENPTWSTPAGTPITKENATITATATKTTPAQTTAEKLTPSYKDADGTAGKPVTTDAPTFTDADGKATTAPEGTKYKLGDGAPEGATIDENTGKVTYTPNESEAGKPVEIPVVVTYPDQSTDKTTAKINVAKLDDVIDRTNDPNAETPAGYHRVTFEAGEGVEALTNPPVYDVKDGVALPADKYPTAKAKEGYENPTWSTPAGTPITKENATITATATKTTPAQTTADKLTPSYADKDGKAGEAVTTDAPTFTDKEGKPATAPEGTKYTLGKGAPEGATIDENTGKVTYTPKESEAGKPVEIPVVVTYPDKSTDNATAKINVAALPDVIDRTDDPNQPTPEGYVRVTFTNGEGVNDIAKNKVYDVKEGVALTADQYPEVTAKEGYENPVWSTPAGKPITKDNATITATATKTTPAQTTADKLTPSYADKDGKAGEAVTTDAPTFTDKEGKPATAPEGTKYTLGKGAPEGATIDENTGKVTYTPKESEAGKPVEIPVVVTYPDKSTDDATAKINVAALPDVIDRTDDPNQPTPEGYVRVTFTNGEGVNDIAKNKVYDVKEGKSLTADQYPEVTAKEGYENPVWSTPAGTAITKDNATITATATKIGQTQKPVITTPKADDKTITGTSEPNAKVVVELPDGTKIETTADKDGNWKADVPAGKDLKEKDVVKATATVDGKKPSDKATTTVKGKEQSEAPKVKQPTEGDDKITGTGKPGAEIVVKGEDGKEIGKTKVDDKGNWEVKVPEDKPLKKDDKIVVEQKEEGKTPNTADTTVKGKDQSEAPKVNQPTEGDDTITGTGKPGAKIVVTDDKGNKIGEAEVNEKGEWKVQVPADKPLKKGDKIIAEQTEEGKKPSTAETTVKGKDQSEAPKVNQPTEGDDTITGTGKPGAKIVVTDDKGNKIGEAEVNEKGEWKVEVPKDKPLNKGDKITAEQTEEGKKPNTAETTVKGKDQSEAPKVNQPTEGDDTITGTGKPGAKIVVTDDKGNKIGEAEVNEKGEWKVEVPKDKPLKKGDKIIAEQTEEGKKPSTAETIVKGKDDNGSGNGHINIPFIPDSNADEGNDDKKPEEDNNKKVKTDAEKNPANKPEKTGVKDKNHLTNEEKQEVIDKVKKANPAAIDVIVDDKGNATLIYADGSKNFINADDLIYQVAPKKEMRSNTKGKKAGANVKTGVGSVSGLVGLAGISIAGLLASRKKEEEDK